MQNPWQSTNRAVHLTALYRVQSFCPEKLWVLITGVRGVHVIRDNCHLNSLVNAYLSLTFQDDKKTLLSM